jgi:undecaprenyl phosphate-alpha-L-ara4FN deformylase
LSLIALKIDVDTFRGTREGVPKLAQLLERAQARATFLFSLGPDHTGRAVRRAFRRGFVGKVRRTSVVKHYGIKTLLYGTLLPGPHIGRRCRDVMRRIAERGFEVGVHTYDHVKWQDSVSSASEAWTRRELTLASDRFAEVFGRPARVHGAAGWQINRFLPELQRQLGFEYASDSRGVSPFMPVVDGKVVDVPQLPTTLPTLDELIGRPDLGTQDPIDHLLQLTEQPNRDHVYTLHAELEGGLYADGFERLLRTWRARDVQLVDLASYAATLDFKTLPRYAMEEGAVEGRSGTLATQARVASS